MLEKIIKIYTDGACSGNPGPGGWGALLKYNGHEKELSGFEAQTTNNQMELQAVIEALKSVKSKKQIKLYTDSKYVMHGITEWIHNWKKNDWKSASKKPVKNVERWQALDHLNAGFDIEYIWVKGHAGHAENERADELARAAIENNR